MRLQGSGARLRAKRDRGAALTELYRGIMGTPAPARAGSTRSRAGSLADRAGPAGDIRDQLLMSLPVLLLAVTITITHTLKPPVRATLLALPAPSVEPHIGVPLIAGKPGHGLHTAAQPGPPVVAAARPRFVSAQPLPPSDIARVAVVSPGGSTVLASGPLALLEAQLPLPARPAAVNLAHASNPDSHSVATPHSAIVASPAAQAVAATHLTPGTLAPVRMPDAPSLSAENIATVVTGSGPVVLVPSQPPHGSGVAAGRVKLANLAPSTLGPADLALPSVPPHVASREAAHEPPRVCLAQPGMLKGEARPQPLPAQSTLTPAAFGMALAAAAQSQTSDLVIYNDRYRQIAYPMGDVQPLYGVCTDVIIRAYRAFGIDLQQRVHESGLGGRDTSIGHRRTEALRSFFARYGQQLPVSTIAEDYLPGDIVTYNRPQNRHSKSHIAIVSNEIAPSGRYRIVHNRGWGPQIEDALFVDGITGHYRYSGATGPQPMVTPVAASGTGPLRGEFPRATTSLTAATAVPDCHPGIQSLDHRRACLRQAAANRAQAGDPGPVSGLGR